MDKHGRVVRQFRITHTAESWKELAAQSRELGSVAVAVETNQCFIIERLLASDVTVYPVNPKSAERREE